MSDEVKVNSVELTVGGATIKLTPENARKLRDALNSLLGDDRAHRVEYVPYRPYWTAPWWTSNYAGAATIFSCKTEDGGSLALCAS